MYNNNGAPSAGESDALLQWESSIGLNRVDPKTGGKTTLMLKNLLASQSQKDVLDLLAQEKFRPGYSFDFFYLPIDFRSRSNYGYCFINFVTMAEAKRFHASFHHTSLHASAPRKLCEVGLARVQGKKNNIEQFRNSPINAIPSAIAHYRPLIFDPRGNLQPFPEPDQPLPTLQLRESRRKYGNGAPGAATNTAGKGQGARTHSLHHPNFAGAVNSSPGGSPVCVSPEHGLSTTPAGLCMQPVAPAGVHQTFPAMNGLAGFSTASIPGGGVNGPPGGMCMSFQGPTPSTCAAAASSAAAILAATIGGPLAAGAVTTTSDQTATGELFGLGMAPPPVGAATSTSPSFLSSSATAARATATGTPTGALAAAASSANAMNNSGASANTTATDNSTAAAATVEDVLQHSTATNASTTNSAAGASSNGGGSAPPADFHIAPPAANATKAIGVPNEQRAAQSAIPVQLELAPMQPMNMSSGQHNFHHQKSVIGTPSTAASSPLIFDYTRTDPSMGTLPYFAPGGYVWNNPASYLNVHPSYHLYHHGGAAYTATAEQGFW